MWPRFWDAGIKRWKDAGCADSCTIGAPEDAPARRVIVFQKPGGHGLKEHYFPQSSRAVCATSSGVGTVTSSSGGENGMGTSSAPSRFTGASRL